MDFFVSGVGGVPLVGLPFWDRDQLEIAAETFEDMGKRLHGALTCATGVVVRPEDHGMPRQRSPFGIGFPSRSSAPGNRRVFQANEMVGALLTLDDDDWNVGPVWQLLNPVRVEAPLVPGVLPYILVRSASDPMDAVIPLTRRITVDVRNVRLAALACFRRVFAFLDKARGFQDRQRRVSAVLVAGARVTAPTLEHRPPVLLSYAEAVIPAT